MSSRNKDSFLSVRLTPHQIKELEDISKAIGLTKSKIIRTIIDNFIDLYYEKENNTEE